MPAQQLGYSGVLFTDRRKFYPQPQMVAQLYAPETPFLSTVMAREAMGDGARQPDDKHYKLFEHRQHWRYQDMEVDAVESTFSDGSPGDTATIDLKNVNGLKENDSLLGMTFDVFDATEETNKGRVLATGWDANNNHLTIKAIGNPTAADFSVDALAADDQFHAISSAFGEGDDAPEAYSDELDVVWNSVQRERTAIEITEDLRRAVLRGERKELARVRNTKQNEHKVKNARNFLFGMRVGGIGGVAHRAGDTSDEDFVKDTSGDVLSITDADGRDVTTTMGWVTAMQRYADDDDQSIQQNWFDRDAQTYDFIQFVEDTEKIAQYQNRDVVNAYCAPAVMSFWSTKALTNNNGWQVQISDRIRSRLGFNYRVLETPHLAIRLINEPVLRGTPHGNKMMMPDLEHVGTAEYAPDTYETNIKTDNNPDIQKDELTSWKGMTMRLIERHFLVDFSNLLGA